MFKTATRTFAIASATALALLAPASAQEQTFRITQVFPATHWHWTEGMEIFTKAVAEASGGKIGFEVYHAGQLGKESTSVVTSGLADFGLLVPSYENEKLPLTSVVELPGLHSTSCEATARYWQLAQEGGALYETEYKALGVRPLYVIVLAPYQVMTSSQKIGTLDDLAGLKIRALGAAMDKTVRSLGAVPVRVTSNELYDALSRGTVDGGFWPIGSTKVVGLDKVFNYTVQGPQLGGGSTFFAISEAKWQSLDDET
ncbi:MAG TPA: TRAP transporter substrate-binding protein DctP, partial [Paracoccaceae bacterium]|nr:TRAP transporter substrate-binding protein DctP [Paracoccaceae bacterium]